MRQIIIFVVLLITCTNQIKASAQSLTQGTQARGRIQELFALTEELTTPGQGVELVKLDTYLFSLKKLITDCGEALYQSHTVQGVRVLTPAQELVIAAHNRFIPSVATMRGGGVPQPRDYAFIVEAYNKMQRPDVAR